VVKAAPAIARATDVPRLASVAAVHLDRSGRRPIGARCLRVPRRSGYLARHSRHKTHLSRVPPSWPPAALPCCRIPMSRSAAREPQRVADEGDIEFPAKLVVGNRFAVVASNGRSPHSDPTLVRVGAHSPLQHPYWQPLAPSGYTQQQVRIAPFGSKAQQPAWELAEDRVDPTGNLPPDPFGIIRELRRLRRRRNPPHGGDLIGVWNPVGGQRVLARTLVSLCPNTHRGRRPRERPVAH
jgi:hypothetical protein